jgi:chromosome segregation ATPase
MENEIVFDTSSGFSVEEQQEILNQINSLTVEKGIVPAPGDLKTEAKKKGVLFPLLVNIAAIILLAGGFLLLLFFHGQDEAGIRQGTSTLGLTERKLIQEIHEETKKRLSEKENEINGILSALSDAARESRELEASVDTLTEEQRLRAEQLKGIQEEYRNTLANLQTERTNILEDARLREADLRAQAEARAVELSSQIERSQQNLTAAMEELQALSTEQERANAAEAQLGGLYAAVYKEIAAGQFDNAGSILASMEGFLGSPLVQSIRSLDTKRRTHLEALASLKEALAQAKKQNEAAGVTGDAASSGDAMTLDDAAALLEQISLLEQKAADQQKLIAAFNAQGSEQGQMITDFQNAISELRGANANQQQALNQRDGEIQQLRVQAAELDSARAQAGAAEKEAVESRALAEELQTRNATLTQTNADLRQQIEAVRQLLLNQQ